MRSHHSPALTGTAASRFDGCIDAMNSEDGVQQLTALLAELKALPQDAGSADFESWRLRTRSALTRALGEQHYMTQEFLDTS
jgi:hypothetical protein